MKFKTKKVYYCDFCKKHGLSSYWIQKHEKHCTLNPNRECRMCNAKKLDKNYIKKANLILKDLLRHKKNDGIRGDHVANFNTRLKKEILEELVCPICTLAIYRQSNKELLHWVEWDFKKECREWWQEENEEQERMDLYRN